ncbi:MAG: radical SAM protein [Candidatus Marithrix sp.]
MIRIAFCQHFFYEQLGVMLMSAQLKKQGHYVEVFIKDLTDLYRRIEEFDLVCFTMMTPDVGWTVKNLKEIKTIDKHILTIAGGPYTTFFPNFIEECGHIDIICVGEGDEAILELADAIDKKIGFTKIQNLIVKTKDNKIVKNPLRPLIKDLDQLPFCDREIYDKYKYFNEMPFTNIMAIRGCPYKCTFCFNHSYNKLYNEFKFRLRSPKNVINEVKQILKKRDIKMLMFTDSTFNLDVNWCIDFFALYKKELNVPFTINLAVNACKERVIEAIADTGCCQFVRMGIESGSEKIRKDVMKKNFTNKRLMEVTKILQKNNIDYVTYWIFGVPFETKEDAIETIKIARQTNSNGMDCFLFRPYRGLDITSMALENNFITEQDLRNIEESYGHHSVMHMKDIQVIENIFYLFRLFIYFPKMEKFLIKLAELKPNAFYRLVSILIYGFEMRKLSFGFKRTLIEIFYHKDE